MDLNYWRDEFGKLAEQKFTHMGPSDRLLSVYRQLADVSGCIHKAQDLISTDSEKYNQLDHRIAAAIADLFILAKVCDANLDLEIKKVLAWYSSRPSIRN